MTGRWRWAALACTAAVLVGVWRFLALAGFNDDHYVHLSGAQQIAFGEWPSRDFVDAGAPLMYWVSSVVFWASPGAPLFGEAILVALMFALSAALTVYAVRRLTGSLPLGLMAVAIEIVIFPRTYSYPKLLMYAAGFVAMWRYVDRPSRGRMVLLALVVVAAFLMRYDHGVYIGLGSIAAVMLTAPRMREAIRAALVFGAMLVVLLLPYLAYVQYYDGFARHLRRGMQMSALEDSRGRDAPSFVFDHPDVASNAIPWLYYEFHLLPYVTALVVLARWRAAHDRRELAIVLPLVVVAVPMNLGLIRETLQARLPDAVVPASLQLAWLVSCLRDLRAPQVRVPAWAVAIVIVLVTGASAVAVGATKEQLERAEVLDGLPRLVRQFSDRAAQLRARFPPEQMPSRTAHALLPFFAYVDRCLGPRDHIFVPAFLPEVAVWARRPFAGGQVTFQAGALAEDEDHNLVIARLEAQRVPAAVLTSATDLITPGFPALARYLDTHFPEKVEIGMVGDRSVFVGFNPRLAVGRDRETGWYCYR